MKRWSTPGLILAAVIGLLLIPVVLAVLALLGRLPSDSVSAPPGWENAIGERALEASLERRAAGLRNPIAANDAAALLAGIDLYRENCAGCHGGVRGASEWGSKGFYPRVPQFWQQPAEATPEEAFAAIHDGIRYSGMAAWRDLLSDEEIWQVANFVARMHSLPPAVERQWRARPAAAPAG
jgi:mono/diheme cytochrome c family protein